MKKLVVFLAQLGILSSLEAKECFIEQKRLGTEEFFVEARFYPAPGSEKTLIILPPTGGTNIIESSYDSKL